MRHLAKRPATKFLAAAAVPALLALLTLGSASADFSQPKAITDQADDMRALYLLVLGMGIGVGILVEGALVIMLFRFKRRSDELPPQIHGNNLLEVIWTGIPVVIVVILFVFSFIVLVNVEKEGKTEDLSIEVSGFQFQWEFKYTMNDLGKGAAPSKQGTVSVLGTAAQEPTLVIPVGEPVQFKLSSNDVIHSFYVRNFLYKLDVVPGRDNQFTITAHTTGEFEGQCAELCGLNHALMRFHVRVVERAEFDKWIAEQKITPPAAQAAAKQP